MNRMIAGILATLALVLSTLVFERTANAHYYCVTWQAPEYSPPYLTLPHWNLVNMSVYSEYVDTISAWEGAGTAVRLPPGDQYTYREKSVNANYGDTGWHGYGFVHATWFCGQVTDGNVLLNDFYLTVWPWNGYYHRRFVECQELGHTLTLDHADGYVSCMSNSAGDSYWYPQQHERDDMNARYPQ